MKELDLLIQDYQCDLPRNSLHTQTVTLGNVLSGLQTGSFLLPGLILAAPFVQPLSLGPLATACSLAFILMGWQIWRGDQSLTLPRKLREAQIPVSLWCKLLHGSKKVFCYIDRFTAIRYTSLTDGLNGRRFTGLMIIAGGLLMMIPFIGVPLNNTFPALMILCALIGFYRRDGFLSLLSIFWGIISAIYFIFITALLIQSGSTLLQILARGQ